MIRYGSKGEYVAAPLPPLSADFCTPFVGQTSELPVCALSVINVRCLDEEFTIPTERTMRTCLGIESGVRVERRETGESGLRAALSSTHYLLSSDVQFSMAVSASGI